MLSNKKINNDIVPQKKEYVMFENGISEEELQYFKEFSSEDPQHDPNPNITYKQILEFPMDIFPKEIREFGEAVAESVKAPIDFFATSVIGTASALIGQQYQIWTKSDKSIFASVWVNSIGKSGSGKSDMQAKGVSPAFALQKRYKREHDEAMKEYKEAKKNGEEVDEPVLKQIIASNATIESLKDLLEEGAVLLYVDESAGWIKAMGQYKKGTGGEIEEFLSISDNSIVMVNRKNLRQQIDNPYMAFIGGTQPSKLEQLITLQLITDDGFLERFLLCFPNEVPAQYNPIGAKPIFEQRYVEYMNKLLTLNKSGITKDVFLDSDAKALFDSYMIQTMYEINSFDFDIRLESYWRKTFKNLSRLILITHLIYVASGEVGEKEVNVHTVEASIRLMDYFKSHFAKMVRYSLGTPEEQKYEALCAYMMKYDGYIEIRKLASRKTWGNTSQVRAILEELAVAGLGEFVEKSHFNLYKK